MTNDPFSQYKINQKQGWGFFSPLEAVTTPAAATLVEFAKIKPNQHVLDCACGTGVVAITAARKQAKVNALDLAPALLVHAKENAALAQVEIEFSEGDVEALPFANDTFDIVLSQFGHMFAPRPEVTISEMLRVLKPGGTIAFSTWPPDHFVSKLFTLTAKYSPPPPGVAAPQDWGTPEIVKARLGDKVKELTFDRSHTIVPMLSPQHGRNMFEKTAAPLIKLVNDLTNDQKTLMKFRNELESLIEAYAKNNILHQHYLMSKATKV